MGRCLLATLSGRWRPLDTRASRRDTLQSGRVCWFRQLTLRTARALFNFAPLLAELTLTSLS